MITAFTLIVALVLLFPSYMTHRSMAPYRQGDETKRWAKFSDFKKEFYKVEWKRDIENKFSFFTDDSIGMSLYNDVNYIHASIVVVNNIHYIFEPISFVKFSWFIFKNRTTNKNKDSILNSVKDLRKKKLKKLKN